MPVTDVITLVGTHEGCDVDIAMQWNDSYSELVTTFHQHDQEPRRRHAPDRVPPGALTRTINNYASEYKLVKDTKVGLSGDDLREGLTAVISVKVGDPKYSNQAKDKLVSSEVATAVSTVVAEKLQAWPRTAPQGIEDHHPEGLARVAGRARRPARRARRRARAR